MADEKIVFPSYKRAGNCVQCGADVYAPDVQNKGGWPLMSACECAEGPDLSSEKQTGELKRVKNAAVAEQAKAA